MEDLNYKIAGVDIAAGELAVRKIKTIVRETFNKNVLTDLGSFGGLYSIDLNQWKSPIMVGSTDGVGTKIMIAGMASVYNTVGQDLVNHCVNDILVQGALPQFFMDYIGVGRLDPEKIEKIVEGLAKACCENEMSLIGGEMAEMPGIYQEKDFDLCGTIVGLVEKDYVITGNAIKPGDIIVAFPSNGLHTNGYSLVRKIVFDHLGLKVDSYVGELQETLSEALLRVHISYLPIMKRYLQVQGLHGMAHITGGGIPGNLKRVIPDHMVAVVDTKSWEVPRLFTYLGEAGSIETDELYQVFNMGIGFVAVVDQDLAKEMVKDVNAMIIGEIQGNSRKEKVILK